MYSPPTKQNWNKTIPYEKKYTDAYQKGYDDGKLGKTVFKCPYDNTEWLAHFWKNGLVDYCEDCYE